MRKSVYEQEPENRPRTRPPGHSDEGNGRDQEHHDRPDDDYRDERGQGRRRRDRDLTALDKQRCEFEGNKKESDYYAGIEKALTERSKQFDDTLVLYENNRTAAEPALKTARNAIEDLLKKLRCISGCDRELLDAAWNEVLVRVEKCSAANGGPCLDDDCEFDDDVCDVDLAELRSREATYTARVVAAEAKFDELIKEPALLTARIVALTAEVAAVAKDLAADPPADPELTYIKALVAEYHAERDQIWAGFAYPNAYEDCLRTCQRCSIRGRRVLTRIVGEIAVQQCKAAKRLARCIALKAHLATETKKEADELRERDEWRKKQEESAP
ncbi:hypothetical protein [Paractinoplanes toevensis]|uniref:Uncharacterized protein n=1 Tax=Paractinoplanes toevensis TaxID=571911 RepID=A0A919TH01_9ACTN|nr:hypothetical protein [Actinoplanes toevensis]GIM94225.1 hypothetical protein Ato02nite_060180 [Actinoplanes toevensis]